MCTQWVHLIEETLLSSTNSKESIVQPSEKTIDLNIQLVLKNRKSGIVCESMSLHTERKNKSCMLKNT